MLDPGLVFRVLIGFALVAVGAMSFLHGMNERDGAALVAAALAFGAVFVGLSTRKLD